MDETGGIGGRKVPAFAVVQGAVVLVQKDATGEHLAYIVVATTTRQSSGRAWAG